MEGKLESQGLVGEGKCVMKTPGRKGCPKGAAALFLSGGIMFA